MTQGELWQQKWQAVVDFVKANKRMPSKYDDSERGRYCNWIKHNRKLYNNNELKPDREERFKEILELSERYKHKNQYE